MQTEADLSPVTDLPIEESSTVTRATAVEDKPDASTMTVKEEAEVQDAEGRQLLCDSPVLPPAVASTGGGSVEQEPGEFRYCL
jgi:hypothetical protein